MPKQETPRKPESSSKAAARGRRNSAASRSNGVQAPPASAVSHEAIAARAYSLFLARGGQPGDASRDWFQAEAELRQEMERAGRSTRE
jgi:DUF2934 family protein